ncbi:hypothetical protein [Phyllobacterium chamaecytisi]|uniref:hypothetical protein n=1 Tax=Phyllobacterium chamaecytisi TaxID=2876082 RepID=UPI001CCD14FA|nr:hypothetical protein [Phyllobacterium sp. KW56]MBZ9605810.1 hypothetical protein [Phyllobacterium sp. KW56]
MHDISNKFHGPGGKVLARPRLFRFKYPSLVPTGRRLDGNTSPWHGTVEPHFHKHGRASTMLRIKHGVQTTFGDILWDEPLLPIYATREECVAAIESFITGFDHYEEEPAQDRWCAWNDNKKNEFHYWWITIAERPLTDTGETVGG